MISRAGHVWGRLCPVQRPWVRGWARAENQPILPLLSCAFWHGSAGLHSPGERRFFWFAPALHGFTAAVVIREGCEEGQHGLGLYILQNEIRAAFDIARRYPQSSLSVDSVFENLPIHCNLSGTWESVLAALLQTCNEKFELPDVHFPVDWTKYSIFWWVSALII